MSRPLSALRSAVNGSAGAFHGSDQLGVIVRDRSDTLVNDVRSGKRSVWHADGTQHHRSFSDGGARPTFSAEEREASKYRKSVGTGGGSRQRVQAARTSIERALRIDQVRAAMDASRHEHTRACVNERNKRLYSGRGMIATQGGHEIEPSELAHIFLERDAEPMAHEAIEMINLIGVVPIAFRSERIAGLGERGRVPYVPSIETFVIKTYSIGGLQQYRFYWRQQSAYDDSSASLIDDTCGDYDPNVLVLDNFGYRPQLDGQLRSNYYVISTRLQVISELTNLALRAERISSNPPILSEHDPTMELQDAKTYGQTSFVGRARAPDDIDDECIERERASRARDGRQMRALRRQADQWARTNGLNARSALRIGADGQAEAPPSMLAGGNRAQDHASAGTNMMGEDMPWMNSYFLGAGRTYKQPAMPRARTDLVELGDQARSIVCAVLNTPEGLIHAASHVRAGVEASTRAMEDNVRRLARQGSYVVTRAWQHSLGQIDLRNYLRRIAYRRFASNPDGGHILSEGEIRSAKRHADSVRFEFDLTQATTPDRLERLYAWGLLTPDRFATAMMKLEGFSHEDAQHPMRLTQEDRKQILVGVKPETKDSSSSSSSSSSGEKKTKE